MTHEKENPNTQLNDSDVGEVTKSATYGNGKQEPHDEPNIALMNEPENELLEKSRAPDGGWGWIIVLECFIVHMIVDGITYTFGIILAEMVRSFGSERSETSWVGSVQTCLMLLLGKLYLSTVVCNFLKL